ncbi:MAG TPA: RDD family protein [Dehalococcoidia bacterium]|jgi:uncharacterized RDD family membrane protein YckC|nr:RDD family protein [Dehalococcoidia bacterium]
MNEQPATAPLATSENVTGTRIVAAIIDLVLLTVVFGVMAALFGDFGETEETDFAVNLDGLPALAFFIIALAYYFVCENAGGRTLGKKLMGIRVVAVDGPLTSGKVAIRTLLRVVDALPIFYLLGLIVIAVSQRKQRIGDMAAGTLVVKA